ncbi:uncharacterized protein LOC106079323 isoform X2 [Biomphalaria glabrata]|uniref:Uncharacterized protein LOC106079323 isoform X2 n=1 Tax=Biomphalaria glabrata TaxID=6526 RepID=A0A9W2YPS3_BIOGL|nr:uncharacterized protein LOC106079323 isoform X2 [Biomphalaria glabrata]
MTWSFFQLDAVPSNTVMPTYAVALSWIVLSPVAFLSNILAIIFVLHYRPLFHSCDVALVSLLVAMATDAVFLFPVQAVVELGEFLWSQELCTFYVWLFVTLRALTLLVILMINVYWMASLRVTLKGQLFTSSKSAKFCVCICWLASVLLGIIPATGGVVMFQYYEDGVCKFLPANISFGFALVFTILPLLSFIMGLISSIDSMQLFRQIRSIILARYNAGRFRLPNSTSGSDRSAHAKYNELNVSTDLCRLVIALTLVSSALNGLPLMVAQFVQMIQDYDRVSMETTLLYLLLIEALVVPHLIWLLSDRYRHAAAYTWKVFVQRDSSYREEDAASCVLQAFRFQVKSSSPRRHANGSGPPKENGNATSIDENELSMIASPGNNLGLVNHQRSSRNQQGSSDSTNGRLRTIMTTDLDDGMTVITHVPALPSPDQEIHLYQTLMVPGQAEANGMKPKEAPKKSPRNFASNSKKLKVNGSASSPALEFPQTSSADVSRSPSSSSRQEWKEKMKKKYLPAVLLDKSADDIAISSKSFKGDEMHEQNVYTDIDISYEAALKKAPVVHSPSTESNYYISSDYHYSYLADSATSATLKKQMSSQDDGMYESCDIVSVLGDTQATQETVVAEDIYAEPIKNSSGSASGVVSTSISAKHPVDAYDSSVTKNTFYSDVTTLGYVNAGFEGHPDLTRFKNNVIAVEFEEREDEILAALQAENSKEVIESTTTLKSFIRRDNYRKFLPYTNLIISSVDVEEEQSVESRDTETKVDIASTGENQRVTTFGDFPAVSKKLNGSDIPLTHQGEDVKTAHEDKGSNLPHDDYNRLETVSGTEMLMLKMKKVRQAIAMDSTDDSTYSGDSSNDWSSEVNDQSQAQDLPFSEKVDNKSDNSLSSVANNLHPKSHVIDESLLDTSDAVKMPSAKIHSNFHLHENAIENKTLENNSASFSDLPVKATQKSKQANYSSNPFLRESFEQSMQSSQYSTNVNSNPFFSSDDIFIGPEFVSSFPSSTTLESSNVNSTSTARPKPKRQSSSRPRHTSSEDELDSIFDEREEVFPGSSKNPFFTSKVEDVDTAQNESDSDASDRSVIIKPYGRRRPAWMEDPLMTTSQGDSYADLPTSESDTDTLGDSNHFSTFSMTVTDDSSHGVVEYDFDAVNIGGVSNNNPNTVNYLRALKAAHPNVVQYQFDEEIERGFEDALAVNYASSHSLSFGGLGLCFESIKEEPEESLSESLTSLDGVELDPKTIFKTQAVVSRPPSRASITSPSLSYPSQEIFQENFEESATSFLPTFERTSADGSDDVIYKTNGNTTPPKPPLDPWGFALPVVSQRQGIASQPFRFSVDFDEENGDIERADDIVTSLALEPERTNPFKQSDWANESQTNPSQGSMGNNSLGPTQAKDPPTPINTSINSAYF